MGSGRRWHYGANDTTDDYRTIDVRRWQRDGFLTPGRTFGWQWTRHGEVTASIQVRVETDRVCLIYRHRNRSGEWVNENYPVWLDWTACNLGGKRPWFRCPARGCGRRVAILYGGGIFACRQCYKLAYPSQREPSYGRARLRADRIRAKLGWEPGILNGGGLKPKGMHWRTFMRLFAEYEANVKQVAVGMASWIGLKR
ncbi:MAG: hypothetical protein OEV51_05545 [Nitrospira sp.]|nr:hypothetical protein [Nitrospira sp.]